MYELIGARGNTFYVQSPAKIGVIALGDGSAVLIDSGSDRDAAKKVKRHLDARGWGLRAVYNTHSHADHIGGNKYLQDNTGCGIYAPGVECAFTRWPILEPSLLWGGCPPKELRHKFTLAQPSNARELTDEDLPEGFDLIPLPGHCPDMVGYRTPDDVVFLADCVSSRETLEKYRVGYIYDVGQYLETLERVKALEAALFVPSHADPVEDVGELAALNIDAVHEVAETVLELMDVPRSVEELLAGLFRRFGLTMTFQQHALIGSTLRSYLTWLQQEGRAAPEITGDMLMWRAV